MFFNVHIPPQGYGEHIKNLWLQNNQWVSDVRSDQKILKIFSQHFNYWGRCLWRLALVAMVEVVEQRSADFTLRADGARPRHLDTPRYPQWEIFQELILRDLYVLQATHWCVTVRWGGTRGGITMDGRFVYVFFLLCSRWSMCRIIDCLTISQWQSLIYVITLIYWRMTALSLDSWSFSFVDILVDGDWIITEKSLSTYCIFYHF